MLFVADTKLGDQIAQGLEDRSKGVSIAGQDHPCRQRSGTAAAEDVEGLVDDLARVGLVQPGALDRLSDLAGDPVSQRTGELHLKPRGRAKMMQQVGVGPADLGCNRLQGDGLRAPFDQEPPCRVERGGPAFLRVEAFSTY